MSIRRIFNNFDFKYKLPGLFIFLVIFFYYLKGGINLNFRPGIDYNRLARDGILKKENVTNIPTIKITARPINRPQTSQQKDFVKKSPDTPWGVAEKIGEHTYTIKVGYDPRMANPKEIFDALNNYRQTNQRGTLVWDDKLASYASSRADYFKSIDKTDEHSGINNFLENEDGFSKLGFSSVGENSYFGGPLYGVHLIEWVFAKSPGHNQNQLEAKWTHVGIGANDHAVNLVFAKGQI